MTFKAINSASEIAYNELLRKIISLELEPNQPAGEVRLAKMLGISRTPIREALTRLRSEGLVDFRSRSGTVIAPIRFEDIESAQYVREKLELAIIQEAVQFNDKQIFFKINHAIEEQSFGVSEGDVDLFFQADEKMHCYFCELVGRKNVWSVISDVKKHMDRVRRLILKNPDPDIYSKLLEDHANIFESIKNKDKKKATKIMEVHLRRVLRDLSKLTDVYPDYFELETSRQKSLSFCLKQF